MFPLRSSCPLCGSARLRDRFVVASFQITRCEDCTFVFVRERLSVEDLQPYYSGTEGDFVYADESNRANLNFYYKRLLRVLERNGGPGKLLDVGCSSGQFLDLLGPAWEGYGVEFSPAYAAIAQQKHGERVQQGTLADLPADRKFDVITLMDVLDHSLDPFTDLALARELLAPGGRIVVKVHNIGCLYARVAGRNFYAITPPYHLSYFSRRTLALAFEKAGLELHDVRFIGNRLALKTVPYRLAQGNESGLMFNAYRFLERNPLGRIPVYKNLRDIITVVGVRN